MPRYKPPSIKDQGGTYLYLDLPEQKNLHRGLGSKMWRTLRAAGLNKTGLAKVFNVSTDTVDNWINSEPGHREG